MTPRAWFPAMRTLLLGVLGVAILASSAVAKDLTGFEQRLVRAFAIEPLRRAGHLVGAEYSNGRWRLLLRGGPLEGRRLVIDPPRGAAEQLAQGEPVAGAWVIFSRRPDDPAPACGAGPWLMRLDGAAVGGAAEARALWKEVLERCDLSVPMHAVHGITAAAEGESRRELEALAAGVRKAGLQAEVRGFGRGNSGSGLHVRRGALDAARVTWSPRVNAAGDYRLLARPEPQVSRVGRAGAESLEVRPLRGEVSIMADGRTTAADFLPAVLAALGGVAGLDRFMAYLPENRLAFSGEQWAQFGALQTAAHQFLAATGAEWLTVEAEGKANGWAYWVGKGVALVAMGHGGENDQARFLADLQVPLLDLASRWPQASAPATAATGRKPALDWVSWPVQAWSEPHRLILFRGARWGGGAGVDRSAAPEQLAEVVAAFVERLPLLGAGPGASGWGELPGVSSSPSSSAGSPPVGPGLPRLTLQAPADGMTTTIPQIEIAGRVDGMWERASLFVGEMRLPIAADGAFRYVIRLDRPGRQDLTFTLVDRQGKEHVLRQVSVSYDGD